MISGEVIGGGVVDEEAAAMVLRVSLL